MDFEELQDMLYDLDLVDYADHEGELRALAELGFEEYSLQDFEE